MLSPCTAPRKSTQHWEQTLLPLGLTNCFSPLQQISSAPRSLRDGCATRRFMQGRRSSLQLIMGCACRAFTGYISILNSPAKFRSIHWPYMYLDNKVTEKHSFTQKNTSSAFVFLAPFAAVYCFSLPHLPLSHLIKKRYSFLSEYFFQANIFSKYCLKSNRNGAGA